MRRLVVTVTLVLGAAAAATANAPARMERSDDRGVCSAKGIDIYFWPQGHPAIPAIGFPAYAPPHVEFYKPHDVSGPGALAYMDPGQEEISTKQCSAITDSPMPLEAYAPTQTTTSTQKLRCTLSANVDIRLGPLNKVTRRVVTRTMKVHGKKKKVRKTITSTVRIGNMASVGFEGAVGALAEVKISGSPENSSMQWDTRSCVPVDVAG